MLPGYEGLQLTQMEVEEDNPSQNVHTKMPSDIKELYSANTTYVNSPAMGEAVGSRFGLAAPKREGTNICRFCYWPIEECICK